MSSSNIDQVISLPKGGGALKGLGETFSPDLHTGTGNFTVPIAVPAGRNGLEPKISLAYSTGQGNGPFGLGWALSLPAVTRKTSRGVPSYGDADVFLLSGAEALIPLVSAPGGPREYRPRTEGLFARIEHRVHAGENYWVVFSKDGLVSWYGTPRPAGAPQGWIDPGAVADPSRPNHIFAWKITATQDPFGNRVEYQYRRDTPSPSDPRRWDQLYLETIRYADYAGASGREFLVSVRLEYEATARPDPFSDYRAGFEIRTTRRVARIAVNTHADIDRRVREYRLQYGQAQGNGVSLLERIEIIGVDEAAPLGQREQALPPLTFDYSRFRPDTPEGRRLVPVTGPGFPTVSLAAPDLQLADVIGDGLPDLVEMGGVTVRYWRNCGNGHFSLPQVMPDAPAGVSLADPGVQLLDADGDGRLDLMVRSQGVNGYFPLRFSGLWDRRSFRPQKIAPSFSLKDPEVRLVDLDGDGVTDAIRSSARMEFFFNDPKAGWSRTRVVARRPADEFPDVSFADPRVHWADMSGDGLSDIVLVHNGQVQYWPNLGHGDFARPVAMGNSPRFPFRYDPKRVLIGDVDGDGVADLIYIDHEHVDLWINRSGNAWSDPIRIAGTPTSLDVDAVRLVDLLGTGVAGLLFSDEAEVADRPSWFFLDLTGGAKPYLLEEMNNHMGLATRVQYRPSTHFFLKDEQHYATQWQTPLPFPVQVVARVEVVDEVSRGKLTTVYHYRHGYWDGGEREFRGFARVDQFDTEEFDLYHAGAGFAAVPLASFAPPTETRTWFHVGPVGDEVGDWGELDLSAEFWADDPPALSRPMAIESFLRSLPRRVKRDAIRVMRGSVLRTELYARDGTAAENRPYTVTETVYGVREEPGSEAGSPRVFFPHRLASRTTQWERGADPMTRLSFMDDYDNFGQSRVSVEVAVPRGRDFRVANAAATAPYLATRTRTRYAQRNDPTAGVYIVDRVCRVESEELLNDGVPVAVELSAAAGSRFGLTVHFYDGPAFQGLPLGEIGDHGALSRTEVLVLTRELLGEAYREPGGHPLVPPYLEPVGPIAWTSDHPQEFRDGLVPLAGYVFRPADADFAAGYYQVAEQRRLDARGLVVARRDPLGRELTIDFDAFSVLAISATDPVGLVTSARYDYRTFQPLTVTDPNGNVTEHTWSPLGLLTAIVVRGKEGEAIGDTPLVPGTMFVHDFTTVPVSVRTIRRDHHVMESDPDVSVAERDRTSTVIEFSDGLGRLVQTRGHAAELVFGDSTFADSGLSADPSEPVGCAVGRIVDDRVLVSGWQLYDNKGRVVRKYEPFFATGFVFAPPNDAQLGRKADLYYDSRGQLVRTVNPDGSEQLVVYGVPPDLSQPEEFAPTPWEAFTYDPNDNAGRTHATSSAAFATHANTPSSVEFDALGRTVRATVRNGPTPATDWFTTNSLYDIRGNSLEVTDPLGRVSFRHVFDLANRKWRVEHLDAGVRRTIQDASGNVLEFRDSKGTVTLSCYDALNRPTRLWARDQAGELLTLRQRLEYGDELDRVVASDRNQLGRPSRHFDEAGLILMERYDFKGNLVERVRRVVKDDRLLAPFAGAAGRSWVVRPFRADWDPGAGSLDTLTITTLDTMEFRVSTNFDARNRPWRMTYPQDVEGNRKQLRRRFDRGGSVTSVALDGAAFARQIAYNPRGQRVLIVYGNGIMARHVFDPDTFRLIRQRAERFRTPNPHDYCPNGGLLQDLFYGYDLIGNPLTIIDRTPGSGVLNNQDALTVTDATLAGLLAGGNALLRRFTYDPLYRLIRATGRIAKAIIAPRPWTDDPRAGFNSGSHATPNQDNAPNLTTNYVETYAYDPAGNMLWLRQQADGSAWVRHFGMGGLNGASWDASWQAHLNAPGGWLSPPGNTLTHVGDNSPGSAQTHFFDPNGNLIRELADRNSEWDYADRLRTFRVQIVGNEPSSYTQYLYAADGTRVKKLVRKAGGNYDVVVEIDGLFELHRQNQSGATLQNNRVHVTV